MILAQVLRAQIINNDKSNASRSENALALYQDALNKAEIIVQDCRDDCAAEEAKIKQMKKENGSENDEDTSDSEDEDDRKGSKKTRDGSGGVGSLG